MFFYLVVYEDEKCKFSTCLHAEVVSIVISQPWASLVGIALSHFQWVFIEYVRFLPFPLYKVGFYYLWYWGMVYDIRFEPKKFVII